MSEPLTPDICVIGAGSGGLSLAAGAAQFGLAVVLVEKGLMGGDCLNYGCVPSKALIAAARTAHMIGAAGRFGIDAAPAQIDFAALRTHIRGVIAAIAPNDSVERFTGLGVRVIKAEARFVSPSEVAAGDVRIAARRFVVATGSAPLVPPIPGLAGTPFLTNETIFDLDRQPEHLLVVGGGPIGVELAQAFRRLGSAVTIIEAAAPLGREDGELASIALARLRAEGVAIRTPAKVSSLAHAAGRFTLQIETGDGRQEVAGSHLFLAVGRAPQLGGLGLAEAGIAFTPKGIEVDSALRTTNRRVFAVGDVAGRQQFTHVANYHAGLVLRTILTRWPHRLADHTLPRVTYSDPEIAAVGLDEAEAARRHGAIRVLRWPLAENDRAQAERETEGMIKVITARNGRILGAGIVSASAGEMILPWCLAVAQRLNIKAMTGMTAPYPTRGEVTKRVAYGFYAPRLEHSVLPRIARFLVRLF